MIQDMVVQPSIISQAYLGNKFGCFCTQKIATWVGWPPVCVTAPSFCNDFRSSYHHPKQPFRLSCSPMMWQIFRKGRLKIPKDRDPQEIRDPPRRTGLYGRPKAVQRQVSLFTLKKNLVGATNVSHSGHCFFWKSLVDVGWLVGR